MERGVAVFFTFLRRIIYFDDKTHDEQVSFHPLFVVVDGVEWWKNISTFLMSFSSFLM